MKEIVVRMLTCLLTLYSNNLLADNFTAVDKQYSEYQPISEYLPELHSSGRGILGVSRSEVGMPFWRVLEHKGDFGEYPIVRLSIDFVDAFQKDLPMIQELPFDQWLLTSKFIVEVSEHISKRSDYGNAVFRVLVGDAILQLVRHRQINARSSKMTLSQIRLLRELVDDVRFALTDAVSMRVLISKALFHSPKHEYLGFKDREIKAQLDSVTLHLEQKNNLYDYVTSGGEGVVLEEVYLKEKYGSDFKEEDLFWKYLEFYESLGKDDLLQYKRGQASVRIAFPQIDDYADIAYKQATAYRTIQIRMGIMEEVGIDALDWKDVSVKSYIGFCKQEPWCTPDYLKKVEKNPQRIKGRYVYDEGPFSQRGVLRTLYRKIKGWDSN